MMKNTILICGYGPGIAHAVARRFGQAGHPVALIARNVQRLSDAVTQLAAEGIQARAFPADLSDMEAIRSAISEVRNSQGPIGILHWNAFLDIEGDLLATPPTDLSKSFAIRVTGYITAVQASLEDLAETQGTVLTTSGVMALDDPQINAFAVDYAALAISVTAQRKTTNILAHTLAPRGIHVGEVIVNGFVEGTPGGYGKTNTVAPKDIAEQFWQLHTARLAQSVIIGSAVPVSEANFDG